MGAPQQALLGTAPAGGGVPTAGLVAEYLLADNANDTSGNSYNGTVNGTVTFNGDYATFNGAGWIGTAFTGLNSGELTVSFWVNFTNTGDQAMYGSSSGNWGGLRTNVTSSLSLSINGDGVTGNRNLARTLSLSTWYNYIVTRSGSNYYVFENNVLINTISEGANFSAGNFQIGATVNGVVPFKGIGKKMRVYNRAVDASERAALYADS